MKAKPKILIIDDGLDYARAVAESLPEFELLLPNGDQERPCLGDGPAALDYLADRASQVDVVLLDMRFDVDEGRLLPLSRPSSLRKARRFQGLAILRELRARHPELPVVLLTAVADLSLADVDAELATQSMTYVLDGDDLDSLRIRIRQALAERQPGSEDGEVLWGQHRSMQTLRRRLEVLARSSMPVILEGETGTGKSFLAQRVIHARSQRRGPFVVVDLSAVPRDLVPAQLFGALRGSFTGATVDRKGAFELAQGGTLFLDEIHNTPLEVQKQLLVVLQERRVRALGSTREIEVDVKVVAASNVPLAQHVQSGAFRQDLYMRLGPATRVQIPPLRERLSDLEALARSLARSAAQHPDNLGLLAQIRPSSRVDGAPSLELSIGRTRVSLPEGSLELRLPQPAWRLLKEHGWPGNLRELAMVMHNIVSFTLVDAADAARAGSPLSSARLQVDAGLVGELLQGSRQLGRNDAPGAPAADIFELHVRPAETLNKVASEVERQYMQKLFDRCGGDLSRMAEQLLGDAERARAVRLRLNQLGLKLRELRQR